MGPGRRGNTEEFDDADRTISVLGLIGRTRTVADHARAALALPESLNAVAALRELQTERQQLALVVSEHGGVEGIIAVEDLIEELVGEIYDEHDRDILSVEHRPDGSMVLPGTFPVHDLEDLDINIPAHPEVTTIGGLIVDRLGRIPQRGDQIDVHGLHLEVLTIRHRTPEQVRIRRSQQDLSGPRPPRPMRRTADRRRATKADPSSPTQVRCALAVDRPAMHAGRPRDARTRARDGRTGRSG